jgi:hypothetical protein
VALLACWGEIIDTEDGQGQYSRDRGGLGWFTQRTRSRRPFRHAERRWHVVQRGTGAGRRRSPEMSVHPADRLGVSDGGMVVIKCLGSLQPLPSKTQPRDRAATSKGR